MPRLASLLSYPVEWCHGTRVKTLLVTAAGAAGERRFRVVDEAGPVAPRELMRLFVEVRADALQLSAVGHARHTLTGPDAASDGWVTGFLGRPARWELLDAHAALPLLATTTASLANLNDKLPEAVSVERFAPTLILEGTSPFEEDDWGSISVGGATFSVARPKSPRLDFGVELTLTSGQAQLRPGQTLEVKRR